MQKDVPAAPEKLTAMPFINHAANYFPLVEIYATHLTDNRRTLFFVYDAEERTSLREFFSKNGTKIENGIECFTVQDRDPKEVTLIVQDWVNQRRSAADLPTIPEGYWLL
jgi:hypothetical protein